METKNLYIGLIGEIKDNSKGENLSRTINKEDSYVIFTVDENNPKNAIDVFSSKTYLIWNRCKYIDVRDFIGHKAIYDYEGIEKHMLMPADSISLDDLSIIYHKMNNDKKEGKEYPNDLILKCIYSSYEFLIDIDIDDFRKNQYIERLKKIGDDYIHELINLNDKDYESNANISEVDLRVKYLKRIIKLEDEINHLARVNADDLLVDLYSMKKRMTL